MKSQLRINNINVDKLSQLDQNEMDSVNGGERTWGQYWEDSSYASAHALYSGVTGIVRGTIVAGVGAGGGLLGGSLTGGNPVGIGAGALAGAAIGDEAADYAIDWMDNNFPEVPDPNPARKK